MNFLIRDYLLQTVRWLDSANAANPSSLAQLKISPEGWKHLYDLQHTRLASPQGFIAMHFTPSLDSLRDDALIPAIEDAGYDPFIVNKHPHNEDIMAEILAGIRRSRFVIADFTGNRHSVYYETGFARGLGLDIIHTCRRGEIKEVAFDVNHNNILEWDSVDLKGFRRRLADHIESTVGPGPKRA